MYGTGGAISFRPDAIRPDSNGGIFVRAASILASAPAMTSGPVPKGTRRFDWENGVTMYMTQSEILRLIGLGELMLMKVPIRDKTGSFYHERDGVSTRLDINTVFNNNQISGYILSVKRKEQTDTGFKTIATHQLRLDDIIFLSKILSHFVFHALEWDNLPHSDGQPVSQGAVAQMTETIGGESATTSGVATEQESSGDEMVDTEFAAGGFDW